MIAEFSDQDVPMECGECSEFIEGILPMVEHLRERHDYSDLDAANYVQLWADDAYERIELENIEKEEYFRKYGIDPESDYGDEI